MFAGSSTIFTFTSKAFDTPAICDFTLGFASASDNEPESPKSLLTYGTVLKTYTHNFQGFVSNGNQIALAKEYLNNHSGFDLDSFCF